MLVGPGGKDVRNDGPRAAPPVNDCASNAWAAGDGGTTAPLVVLAGGGGYANVNGTWASNSSISASNDVDRNSVANELLLLPGWDAMC
jgi:hypothetical protein